MSNFIYPKNKTIFIHIPKCGGFSVREYFLPNTDGMRIGPFFGHIPKKYTTYRKFTIIRNPYTRFLSLYKMCKYGTTNYEPIIPSLTMKDLINILYDNKVTHTNQDTDENRIKHHSIPQTHPYNCYKMADYIARFENYNTDLNFILHKLGFNNIKLNRHNVSKGDKTHIFKDKNLNKINEYYEEDFLKLNYRIFTNEVKIKGGLIDGN